MSNIYHIRLVNGEELFGELIDINSEEYWIKQPLVSSDIAEHDGTTNIVLTPYLPFTDTDDDVCSLNRDHVITLSKVHPVVEQHYALATYWGNKTMDAQLQKISAVNKYMQESLMLEEMDDQDLVSTEIH